MHFLASSNLFDIVHEIIENPDHGKPERTQNFQYCTGKEEDEGGKWEGRKENEDFRFLLCPLFYLSERERERERERDTLVATPFVL